MLRDQYSPNWAPLIEFLIHPGAPLSAEAQRVNNANQLEPRKVKKPRSLARSRLGCFRSHSIPTLRDAWDMRARKLIAPYARARKRVSSATMGDCSARRAQTSHTANRKK
jgi:hypothetical protein